MSSIELKGLNKCWRPLADRDMPVWKRGSCLDQADTDPYLLLKGRIKLVGTTPDGMEKILWSLGDDCLFNETMAFNTLGGRKERFPNETMFSHVCQTDCIVGRIPMARLIEAGRSNPALFVNLCQSFSLKLLHVAQDLVAAQLESQRTRVFKFLAANLMPGTDPPRYERTMAKAEIANLLGMHRISLYKILKQAEGEGVIGFDRDRKAIVILDAERFAERCEP